jgi:hypothetical protein
MNPCCAACCKGEAVLVICKDEAHVAVLAFHLQASHFRQHEALASCPFDEQPVVFLGQLRSTFVLTFMRNLDNMLDASQR